MSDLLSNPPKIRKITQKEEGKEESGILLLEKTDSSLLDKKKSWKYFVKNNYGQEEGFARSRRGALLKIKWWTIRQEAGKRKRARKNIASLSKEQFLDLVGDDFPLRDYRDKTLTGQKISEDLLLFSAESSRRLLSSRDAWVAGTVRLFPDRKAHTRALATEAGSKRKAEKEALKIIQKELAKEELQILKDSVKERQ